MYAIFKLDAYNVALLNDETLSDENYINASYIDGPDQRRMYIATQGPIMHTVGKFWKLVYNRDARIIVMLCKLKEEIRVFYN
jgi:protein tyrosine phosphatase